MKTETTPMLSTHSAGPALREPRRYSLVEAAQLLGLPLSEMRDLLVRHELHTEAGPRGSQVSQRQIVHYLNRRESAAPAGANFFMRFRSKL